MGILEGIIIGLIIGGSIVDYFRSKEIRELETEDTKLRKQLSDMNRELQKHTKI